MKLLFKQRFFSWFDSYDIYDDSGNTAFVVRGRLGWGHRLEIYDKNDRHLGTVKQRVLTLLPRFELYIGERYMGQIIKKFTLFTPVFTLECNDWVVEGNWLQWDYEVRDGSGRTVMTASKELFNLTDTYSIEVADPRDALLSLMTVLAIDAAKCSAGKG